MIKDRMGYAAPMHTRDEATELVVYHLRMAASLFQLVPDDENEALLDEINRAMDEELEKKAARAWAAVILLEYDLLKGKD